MWMGLAMMAGIGMAQPQAAPPPITPEQEAQRIAAASAIGTQLYAFDRAAWVSSDALMEKVPKDRLTGAGGYVVEPVDGTTLRVTYFRGTIPQATAFFVADVANGKVVRSELLREPVALTAPQTALVRAREVASETAREKSLRPCSANPFNTVVLPSPPGKPIAVYLLSPQPAAGTYPAGGHYRVIVSPDGEAVSTRPFSVSCLDLTIPKLPAGSKPAGMVVSHLLDPTPTEIHVFTSYAAQMPLFVPTRDKRIWEVRRDRITLAKTERGS